MAGSVAVLEGGEVRGQVVLEEQQRTAQSLAPGIELALRQVGWKPKDVQLVAVTAGPGSFTGLRVGVTTAKVFAYAVQAQVLGVDTLQAIAWQTPQDCSPLHVIMDAHRGQLFAARLVHDAEAGWVWDKTTEIADVTAWRNAVLPREWVTGPMLSRLATTLPAEVNVVPAASWMPLADAVGQLAWRQYAAGRRDDVWQLVPNYFRLSAAEEKRLSQTVPPPHE